MKRNDLMEKIRRLEQSKYAFTYTAQQYAPIAEEEDLDGVEFVVEFTDHYIEVAGANRE
jgi:hypothetical protein